MIRDPKRVREPTATAQVIRVNVCIENPFNLEAAFGRRLADRPDVARRINRGRGAGFRVGDEVAETALRAPL